VMVMQQQQPLACVQGLQYVEEPADEVMALPCE
jgi:hypothetical protein